MVINKNIFNFRGFVAFIRLEYRKLLNAAVAGETAHGRKLVVQQHRAVDQLRSCHVLYITGAGPRQAKEIGAALAGRSVLTVLDADGVASSYETMTRFLTEQIKSSSASILSLVTAARLVLDPRLLRSAEVIGE
ncbi:MAG: YfiR family protein [Candidatus Binatia bacterium]